jgi:hypothetical protein
LIILSYAEGTNQLKDENINALRPMNIAKKPKGRCIRDRSGKPTARQERGLGTDSPTR